MVTMVGFFPTSTTLTTDHCLKLKGTLKFVLVASTEVCVTLGGTKQPPRLFAEINLVVDTVS